MKQKTTYTYTDDVFNFEGCVSVRQQNDWAQPWRIDYQRLEYFPVLKDKAADQSSGVRLCFSTNSQEIQLNLHPWQIDSLLKIDVFVDGEAFQEFSYKTVPDCISIPKLPEGKHDICIWLPLDSCFKLVSLSIDKTAVIQKTEVLKKRWVHYGSSISHSFTAHRPSQGWTALSARKKNLHLTNLGFDGNALAEPMLALLIRDLPADFISLKIGINGYGGKVSYRLFQALIYGMLEIIREKHPSTPILCISPIYSSCRETVAGGSALSLTDMRKQINEVVTNRMDQGDANIIYLSGLELLGQGESKYLPDDLHPDGDGQFVIADRFVDYIEV